MEYDAEEKQKTNVQSRRPGIQIALDVDEESEKTDDIVDVRTEQRENLANPTNNFNPSDTNDPFQKVVAAGLVPTSATTPVKSVSPCLNDNQNNREESRNDNKQNEKHPLLKPVSLDESKLANTDEKKEEPVEYEDEDDDVILIEETIEQIDLDDYDDKIEDEEYSLTYSPASTVVLSPKAEQDEIMDDGFVDVEEGLLMLQKGGVDVKIEPIDDGK